MNLTVLSCTTQNPFLSECNSENDAFPIKSSNQLVFCLKTHSASAMSGDGMELPLRGNMQPSIPPSNWVQAPSQRRATLADLSKEFHKGHVKVKPRYDLLAILIIYTMARIVANLFVTGFFRAVLRPVVTGLGIYCFIPPWSQYSSKLRLHVLSWRAILCLAVFLFDESIVLCCWSAPWVCQKTRGSSMVVHLHPQLFLLGDLLQRLANVHDNFED